MRHNSKYKLLFKSLQFKLIVGFLIITMPVIMFLIYNNFYAIHVVRNQIAQSNENMVALHMGQIDYGLGTVDDYLYSLAAKDLDLLNLELSEKGNNQKYYFSKIRLNERIAKDVNDYKIIDGLFIYSANNQELITAQNYNEAYLSTEIIQKDIIQLFQNKEINHETMDMWFPRQVNKEFLLFRIVKIGNVYLGAWTDARRLMTPLDSVDIAGKGRAVLTTENYEPMDDANFFKKNNISLNYERSVYNLTGDHDDYLVVGAKSIKGNFSLVTVILDEKVLEKLPYLQKVIWFISFGLLVILPILYLFLRRTILLPLNRLIAAMKKVKDGDLGTSIPQSHSSYEFEVMNKTFNSMASEIKELKINVYEEQLNSQKAELRHLQLQINPHFFLNSLNIIYTLAQVKQYNLIQEMALCLVHYFRYMFRSNSDFVLLDEEIEHTQNYLKIQVMRFPDNLTYDISLPDDLKNCAVPPLLIQTFVENTIKHAVTMDGSIHISINVKLSELDPEHLQIRIHDTGKGFSKEILQQLQSEKGIYKEEGKHIGIWNVQRRLRLLYEKQATIVFSNSMEGGANVDIQFPLQIEH
ncbi:sensor histidine kinase [Metabacillus bambusae]|uniref:Histidine kinase n=1 Tax=Metabacillus bambusae TaxID=2795218 RepID=A0ABS3MXE8_9BACI|nr:histidine kinase [Metabacillus bambusae]MBO1510628.1 histidine kinase [Metabacillus bambusae]